MKLQDLDFLGSRVLSNLTGEHREEKKVMFQNLVYIPCLKVY